MGDIKKENENTNLTKPVTFEQLAEIVEQHKKDLYTYAERIESQGKTIETQQTLINGLVLKNGETTIKNEPAKKPTIPTKAIKVGDKKYKFTVARFKLAGENINAEDAALDNSILEQIVSINGQGILKEQH
jgi:hypothetical protein